MPIDASTHVTTSTATEDTPATSRRVRFFRHPVTAVVTVVLSMFTMIIVSGLISAGMYLLAAGIMGRPADGPLRTALQIASYLMTTVIAFALILLWRSAARLPLGGLGIAPVARCWLVLPGFVLAVGVDYAAAATAVGAGASVWGPPQLDPALLLAIVVIFLGQAFPEELLWRGHLANVLERRVRPWAVILTTSVVFGALHIVSGSDAQGLGEQLLYVLQATALGLLLIALRLGPGSLWMAIGFHTGYNAFFEVATPITGSYAVELLVRALLLTLCAVPILIVRRYRRTRRPDYARIAGTS